MHFWKLLLGPDAGPLGSVGGGASTPAPIADEPDGDSFDDRGDVTTVSSADPVAGGESVDATPATPAVAVPATEWQSIRDAARASGFDVHASFQDDQSFLRHVLAQAATNKQADYYARLGQAMQPHAAEIQTFLQQRNQPAAPTAVNPWEAPEFNEQWLSMVDRDPNTGLFLSKPGADPQYAQKLNTFTQWKSQYDRNPAAMMNGMVESRAKAIAAETVREQLAIQQRDQSIQSIVSANAEWMYQKDQTGQYVRDFRGQAMPTPVGQRYMFHVQSLKSAGVTDPRMQDSMAKQLVQGEHYAAQYQSANPAAPPTQQRQATNQPNRNPLQTQAPLARRRNPAATEPSITGKSLSELLREELAAEGVTDADFNSQFAG